MHFEDIQWDCTDGIARITLYRPDKLNAFTSRMLQELQQALHHIEQTPSIRALILTGTGKAFSAGQDLSDPMVQFTSETTPPDLEKVVLDYYRPVLLLLHQLRVPTICAVNGVAAGAGVSLALACDLVIAQESATFIQAFAKIGLIPDSGGTWNLVHSLGLPRALGLALLGEKLTAEKAVSMGLIWECVTEQNLQPHCYAIAKTLAQLPTVALVKTRTTMHAAVHHSFADHLKVEAQVMGQLANTSDFAEGVQAFMQKRRPQFIGA